MTVEATQAADLDVLFEPLAVNGTVFPNRLVQPAMYTRFATMDGEVSERHVAYFGARARGGVGLLITEDMVVDWASGRGSGAPLRVDDDRVVPGLAELAATVHRQGALIAGQIYHAGRQSDHRTRQLLAGIRTSAAPPISASDVPSRAIVDRPRPMTIGEIEEMIERFADAARRLVLAGFDAIEIHAVHGYLLTQFFSPESNHRTDAYGGTLENRARFLREVVRRVREVVGPRLPLICRLSADERVPGAASTEDNLTLASWLADDGIDIFNVSAGTYDSREWVYTPPGVPQGSLVPLAARVREVTARPVIGISKLGFDLGLTAEFIRNGQIDMAAMGRTQLADPDAINKVRGGRARNVRPCLACNECAREFIAKQRRVQCVVNPELGNEFRRPLRRSVTPQEVLVIGGGACGLEAARSAATIGHKVTLWEAGDELGGLLRAAARSSFNGVNIERLLEFYGAALEQLEVAVELGHAGSAADAAGHPADAVFLATGTRRRVDLDVQEGVATHTAPEVLLTRAELGERVAVVGGDEAGLHAAIHLAGLGHSVTITDPREELATEISDIMRQDILHMAAKLGVRMLTSRRVTSLSAADEGFVVVGGPAAADVGVFDDVVVAGSLEVVGLPGLQDGYDPRSRYIGSSVNPYGRLYQATQAGYWAAADL